jgi:hypothetical protein
MKKAAWLCTVFTLLVLVPVWGRPSTRVAERVHTRYDAGLGWVNIPDAHHPDMYGEGLDLKINSQGFRDDRAFSKEVPPGRLRILCSGDSFTFGYGVAQRQTWPEQLERIDPRFETVNMGLGGYGVDQSYLWYLRDGRKLDYHVHLFTFVFTDFERMKVTDFFGYHKPRLELEDGRLVVRDAAPPKERQDLSRFTAFRIWLSRFEAVRALESLARKHLIRVDDETVRELVPAIFRSLKEENAKKESALVVVYLPTRMDREKTRLDDLRAYLKEELARQNVAFVDLTDAFRRLDEEAFEGMFISREDARFAGAQGHYTARGNRYVASLIRERALP